MAPKKAAKAASPKGSKPLRRSLRKTTASTTTDEGPSKVTKRTATKETKPQRAARAMKAVAASTIPHQFDGFEHEFVGEIVPLDQPGGRTSEKMLWSKEGGTAKRRTTYTPSSQRQEAPVKGSRPASPAKRGSTKKRPLHGSEPELDHSGPRCVDLSEPPEIRIRKQDEYGRIMRFMRHEGYLLEKYGKDSPEYREDSTGVDQGEGDELTPEDRQFCLDRGRERARQEEIPHVHESGLVMNQADRFSRGKITRPTPTPSPANEKFPDWPAGKISEEGRGSLISPTNERYLKGKNEKAYKENPFFETMPAKEIWHRNMPPFFTFGETPAMEKAVSREIEDDLSKVPDMPEAPKPKSNFGLVGAAFGGIGGLFTGTKPTPEPKMTILENGANQGIWKMWDLPALTAEEKRRIELGV